MTGKQTTVMWMGLILIMLRLFTTNQWHDIWAVILQGQTSKGGSNIPLLPPPFRRIPGGGTAPEEPIPTVPELPAAPIPELPPIILG